MVFFGGWNSCATCNMCIPLLCVLCCHPAIYRPMLQKRPEML
jgi:hypothetical protein